MRDVRVADEVVAKRPVLRRPDADPWPRCHDARRAFAGSDAQWAVAAQVRAVVPHVDGERLAEFGRAVRQVNVLLATRNATAPTPHDADARNRRDGANEHAAGDASVLRHHVQATVLAGAIDVGEPRRPKQHLGARRAAAKSVRRRIAFGQVRLRFHDAPGHLPMRQQRAEQRRRHIARILREQLPQRSRARAHPAGGLVDQGAQRTVELVELRGGCFRVSGVEIGRLASFLFRT